MKELWLCDKTGSSAEACCLEEETYLQMAATVFFSRKEKSLFFANL